MFLTGLALIVLAVIAFVLMRARLGISKLGNRPFLVSLAAAGITGLIAVGVVMVASGFVTPDY